MTLIETIKTLRIRLCYSFDKSIISYDVKINTKHTKNFVLTEFQKQCRNYGTEDIKSFDALFEAQVYYCSQKNF